MTRHWMIQFQRWVRSRLPSYAVDEDGQEIRHPKDIQNRVDFRREKRADRTTVKSEATRTRRQRLANARAASREVWWRALPAEERERRIRRLKPGSIVVVAKEGAPSAIVVPTPAQVKQATEQPKRRGGFRKLASGILVPGGAR